MPGLRAMRGARARARPVRGAAACATGSPAPRSFRRGRRQRRARRSLSGRRRRRSAPLSWPAPLAFFPLPEEGGRAEPSRGRGGAGTGRRRPRTARRRRREAGSFPHRAAGAPQSLALKLDPESGARDCITDYIRLSRASRSHTRGERERGAGCGGGERGRGGGEDKRAHARTGGSPAPDPSSSNTRSWVSALCLSREPRSGCRGPTGLVDGWVDGQAGQMDGGKEVVRGCAPTGRRGQAGWKGG